MTPQQISELVKTIKSLPEDMAESTLLSTFNTFGHQKWTEGFQQGQEIFQKTLDVINNPLSKKINVPNYPPSIAQLQARATAGGANNLPCGFHE